MNKLSLLDTSICTENNGDKIIMDSIQDELKELFIDAFYVNLPTHDRIGVSSYKHIRSSDYTFACGTNLLSSNMLVYKQWKVNPIDTFFLNNVCLLGVGWWQYQKSPDLYTRLLLKRALSKDLIHSVRDSYTENMLREIGVNNVINTSCPTMWNLTPEHCARITKCKSEDVLVTLTNYNKNPEKDKKLINILSNNYQRVYFWVQAYEDKAYIESLIQTEKIIFVGPSINSLDRVLEDNNIKIDYVGTRLHAGIRALQNKRRTIIIGIDNRAIEKSNDFNLTVLTRDELDKLPELINNSIQNNIKIPIKNIEKWKSQFQ
ncbi:polysaccharide pyruvyl transferase family protein [Virgibacillus litoralis]|uniref:Polysaccharide pyruvyl transferase domain-containing protein n=1 Tax=Virgibacillus litoralis TaxID=578221 RepID=A0ABS4HI14_9BACI|nr:polysaccharide pyruvyl transferase family protein [Virgibacillus litoralis]MBP1950560.1 hypothetical protein [Virgibacillus litoralis]